MTEVRRTTLALIGLRKLAEKVSQLGEFRRNRMLVSARPDEDPAHARCAGSTLLWRILFNDRNGGGTVQPPSASSACCAAPSSSASA